jgi:murein DD-endopeptidase MepM/ murein hydrolase activator NlpD
MVAVPRRRRRRPRPSGLVVVALMLCGLTLLTGVVLLANAFATSSIGGGDVALAAPAPVHAPSARAARSDAVSRAERGARVGHPLDIGPLGAGPDDTTPEDATPDDTMKNGGAGPNGAELGAGEPPRPGGWVWPVAGELLRGFEPPSSAWGRGHRGVDLAASPGDKVRTAGRGVVSWAGRVAGRGVVTVTHDGGLRTTYEPVTSQAAVGTRVDAGAAIGVLEPRAGHCGSRSCLHWGLLSGRTYLDPLALVRRGHPVLLPFWPPAPPPAGGSTRREGPRRAERMKHRRGE